MAEQEARTEYLRQKAKKQLEGRRDKELPATSQDALVETTRPSGHINFFQAEEDGEKHGKNDEYLAEKKAEKEKFEKNIGLLTYLGQSAVESQQSKPWYFEVAHRKRKADDEEDAGSTPSKKAKKERDFKRKFDLDPMRQVTKYLDIKDKHKSSKSKDTSSKKHKHKHHERDHDAKSDLCGPKSIDQLRAERLKREREERRRAEEVLAKARGEQTLVKEETVVTDERERKYNSQFNPDFVRRPRQKFHSY